MVWDQNLTDQADLELTAAPLALKDEILVGGSGGDRGVRNWLAALDAKTGELKWKTYSIPAPGEPGSETWKDKATPWQTGGGAFYGTGAYDPTTNLTYWGSGNPVPAYDSTFRPGDNLYTSSAIAFNADNGKITWWHQYTPNDNRDYDETGATCSSTPRSTAKTARSSRMPAATASPTRSIASTASSSRPTQHVKMLTWTKGIDAKTGRPVDYDPTHDVQVYAEGTGVLDGQGDAPDLSEHRRRHEFLAGRRTAAGPA